ncbi:MAG: mechanosensitive ion channel family protein [Thermoflavifilum sp.]|nr:mechanosensitive ion channel family protein [Thermoflavifilum sp.]
MQDVQHFWDITYAGNTLRAYIFAILGVIIGLFILRVVANRVIHHLKKLSAKTTTYLDDFLVAQIQKNGLPVAYLLVIYACIHTLHLSDRFTHTLHQLMTVLMTFFVLRVLAAIIQYALHTYLRHKNYPEERIRETRGMMLIVNIVLWSMGVVFLLGNLGYNVTTLITGLGIGGVAIALASQTILGDLFCYFIIFFDRPFEIGDFIIVGDKMGTVEHIGLKTTRLRSLGGEQLIFSNKDLTDSRIHNYKRMEQRRVVFRVGVVYETPVEKLEKIPALLKEAVEKQSHVRFDRAHFASYGDFALIFEIVYYVLSADYNVYMDIQQAINLHIFRAFEAERIVFAYPRQIVEIVHPQASGVSG